MPKPKNSFSIGLDDKPHLLKLYKDDPSGFKTIVGTFVQLMELSAEKNWLELPEAIHSSISFKELTTAILNAVMSTEEISPKYYDMLQSDLHPLSLLSDKRMDFITEMEVEYDWRKHFSLVSEEVNQETIEKIIRKLLYLVRWVDIDTISKTLLTSQFVSIESTNAAHLPFQPALKYQREHLSDLHVGKFMHDVGCFDCGTIVIDFVEDGCPACHVGDLKETINHTVVCRRCNAGFEVI